jgi:hypothetical protein
VLNSAKTLHPDGIRTNEPFDVCSNPFLMILANAGVDVMITIFSEFSPISAEKIGFLLENQCFDIFYIN